MPHWRVYLACLGLAGLLAGPIPGAEAVILDVLADAYIEDFASDGLLDGVPDAIHDTNALLAGEGLLSSGAAIDSRIILVFDVSPFAHMTLESAALTGFGARVDNGFQPDAITAYLSGGAGDGLITLEDFDRSAAALGAFSLPGQTELFPPNFSAFSHPVTSAVQPLLATNPSYVEFRIDTDALTASIAAGHVMPPFQPNPFFGGPQLALIFAEPTAEPPPASVVPELSSLWLMVSSIGFVALRRGRRKVE